MASVAGVLLRLLCADAMLLTGLARARVRGEVRTRREGERAMIYYID
jgi:hypothetical protein